MSKFLIKKPFSLIEMLIVISIFLILGTLLQPSLLSMQKQAESVVCKGNLKVISGAAALQLEDYNGFLNPAGYVYNTSRPEINNPYMRIDGYILNPIGSMGQYLNSDISNDNFNQHYRDMNKSEYFTDFKCPSNDFEDGKDFVVTLAGSRAPDGTRIFRTPRNHTSYGLNGGFLGIPSNDNQSKASGEIRKVSDPSKMMHMGEMYSNNRQWAVLAAWLEFMTLEDSYKAHTGNRLDWERHDNSMNILFADAHVESVDFYEMARVNTAKGIE